MIALGADHGGVKIKEEIKKFFEEKNIEYVDYGTYDEERTDYPIYAEKVAKAVQKGECNCGILLCRSGAGMTIVANKFKGIRCALGFNEESAKALKADDDVNILAIPSEYMTVSKVIVIVREWLGAEFKNGRYMERIQMIENIEKNEMK